MFDFVYKKKQILSCLLLAAFVFISPPLTHALPVAVEQVKTKYSLKSSAFFLVDDAGDVSILEASSPLRQNHYTRLDEGVPITSNGTLWLRFSLIKNNQALNAPKPEGMDAPLFLDLGTGMNGARLYIAERVNTNGEVQKWHESLPLGNGSFALPDPDLLPMTVYVHIDGIPSLWFDPTLVRGDTDSGPVDWALFMQLALGLALVIVLIRGMAGNEEWRFWAGSILACAIIPSLFGQYGSETRIIYLTAMPRLLAPGLAVMLMPHLGRYLLNSRGNKKLDYTLIILSIPGVIAALAPLVPGLGWSARLLPLAPLMLLPLIFIALIRAKNGQHGSLLYFMFSFFPFLGAVLALLPLLNPSLRVLDAIGPNLPTLGYLLGGIIIALGKPGENKEKTDFFPLNDFLDDTLAPNHGVTVRPQSKLTDANFLDELLDSPPLDIPATSDKKDKSTAKKTDHTEKTDGIIDSGDMGLSELADALFSQPEHKQAEADSVKQAQDTALDLGLDLSVFDASSEGKIDGTANATTKTADALAGEPMVATANGKATAPNAGLSYAKPDDAEPEQAQASTQPSAQGSSTASDAESEHAQAGQEGCKPEPEVKNYAQAKAHSDENIIYIKDEEEPGLIILKPAGPEPIAGVEPVSPNPVFNWEYTAISRLENALRTPYEQLSRELLAIKTQQSTAEDSINSLEDSINSLGILLDNLERLARGEPLSKRNSQTIFNLSQLIRRIHEDLRPLSEERHITLSWFVSPELPSYFIGQEEEISQAVKFLLQGSLEGSAGGAVQLSVRQGSGTYAEQIQFTLQESNMMPEHIQRPSGWLNKAWELAATSGGSFNIDFVQGKGMVISMALPLSPVEKGGSQEVLSAYNEQPMPGSAALAEFAPEQASDKSDTPLMAHEPLATHELTAPHDDEGLNTHKAQDENLDDGDIILLTNPLSTSVVEGEIKPSAPAGSTEKALSDQESEQQLHLPAPEHNLTSQEPEVSTADAPTDISPADQNVARFESAGSEQATGTSKLTEYGHVAAEDAPAGAAESALQADEQNAQKTFATQELNESAPHAEYNANADANIVILEDQITDVPAFITTEVSAPRPASAADHDELEGAPSPSSGPREFVIVADMAASGRRLIKRRLEGLPHKLVEARDADEIVKTVYTHPVGLIIIDADMPEDDIKDALDKTADYTLRHGLLPIPSLCLLSHESQSERMSRLGSNQTQVKSASRVQFRQAVLKLCPHPLASPDELLPESPLLRPAAKQNPEVYTVPATRNQVTAQTEPQPEAPATEHLRHDNSAPPSMGAAAQAKESENNTNGYAATDTQQHSGGNAKTERVPMLDLILASMSEEEKQPEPQAENSLAPSHSEAGDAEPGDVNTPSPIEEPLHKDSANANGVNGSNDKKNSKALKAPYPLSAVADEFMEAAMVPLIPGLLVVLEESLNDLAQARMKPDTKAVEEISGRMSKQGGTFGLSNLERMAHCLEKAAAAADIEAIRDFSDELISLGRRYLGILRETHTDYNAKQPK